MKKLLLLSLSIITFSMGAFLVEVNAQGCTDLFFSEYVEGFANNKALEIYNPTDSPIDLSGYSIARFSNGSTVADPETSTPAYVVSLPNDMLAPYDVYVVVVDLTDTADWDTQYDKPAWNGYNLIDTVFDQVTMEPVLNDDGSIRVGPQYIDGNAVFGTEYNERYDLQSKADVFLCPDYATNRTMYFNGNDAMVLLKGKELAIDGSNIMDVIGVIGENPETSIMEDAWVDADGGWLTKDKSLIRQSGQTAGKTAIGDVVFSQGGTFDGSGWDIWFKNTFCFLGSHICDCDPNPPALGYNTDCGFDPADFTSTKDFNQIKFEMFPNPLTANELTIKAEEAIQSVQIFNLTGQLVLNQTFEGQNLIVQTNVPAELKGFLIVKIGFSQGDSFGGNNAVSVQKLVRQ